MFLPNKNKDNIKVSPGENGYRLGDGCCDGLDQHYPLYTADKEQVRGTGMQTDRANRLFGVFQRW